VESSGLTRFDTPASLAEVNKRRDNADRHHHADDGKSVPDHYSLLSPLFGVRHTMVNNRTLIFYRADRAKRRISF
jgi:hypothetical protein